MDWPQKTGASRQSADPNSLYAPKPPAPEQTDGRIQGNQLPVSFTILLALIVLVLFALDVAPWFFN